MPLVGKDNLVITKCQEKKYENGDFSEQEDM